MLSVSFFFFLTAKVHVYVKLFLFSTLAILFQFQLHVLHLSRGIMKKFQNCDIKSHTTSPAPVEIRLFKVVN